MSLAGLGRAAARGARHPRWQDRLPRRLRHPGAAGRGRPGDRTGRGFPAGMNTAIALPPQDVVEADVARALAEDVGNGDVTAMLLPDHEDIAYLLCKEPAVVCCRPWFDACPRLPAPAMALDLRVAGGAPSRAGTRMATPAGP